MDPRNNNDQGVPMPQPGAAAAMPMAAAVTAQPSAAGTAPQAASPWHLANDQAPVAPGPAMTDPYMTDPNTTDPYMTDPYMAQPGGYQAASAAPMQPQAPPMMPQAQPQAPPMAAMQPTPPLTPMQSMSAQGAQAGGGAPMLQPTVPVRPDGSAVDQPGRRSLEIPEEAADNDVIEKEWIDHAKQIVMDTRSDPYKQVRELNKLKAAYMKKRYAKDLKLPDA